MLGKTASRCKCERIAQAEQNYFQRHVEIEVPRGALLGHFNLTEQVQQRIGVGLLRISFERCEVVKVEQLIPVSSDLKQDQVANPTSQPGEHVLCAVGLRNRFRRRQNGSDRLQGLGTDQVHEFLLARTSVFHIGREGFSEAAFADDGEESRVGSGGISRFRMSAASTCVRAGVVKRRA